MNLQATETQTNSTDSRWGLTSFALHLLAMGLMLCDHMWATVIPGSDWMTCVGRIAYPIFAFMIVEGYFHTRSVKKYMRRLLIFTLITEIPFNLMMGSSVIYPFHQNVLWTFLLSLTCIRIIESVRKKGRIWVTAPVFALTAFIAYFIGQISMVDYHGGGIMMVLVFYLFRGRRWWQLLGQAAGLYWVNWELIRGRFFPIEIGGSTFNLPQQGLAVLALIPIWLYNGKQGPHNKWIKLGFYAFYPVHILILVLIARTL